MATARSRSSNTPTTRSGSTGRSCISTASSRAETPKSGRRKKVSPGQQRTKRARGRAEEETIKAVCRDRPLPATREHDQVACDSPVGQEQAIRLHLHSHAPPLLARPPAVRWACDNLTARKRIPSSSSRTACRLSHGVLEWNGLKLKGEILFIVFEADPLRRWSSVPAAQEWLTNAHYYSYGSFFSKMQSLSCCRVAFVPLQQNI